MTRAMWVAGLAMVTWCCADGAEADAPAASEAGATAAETFRLFCGSAASTNRGLTVVGRDGWLFLTAELRHVAAPAWWTPDELTAPTSGAPAKRPLGAILDYKRQLESAGIEMIVVPVPPKALIYPDLLDGSPVAAVGDASPQPLDDRHQQFYALLRREGVHVLDVTDELRAHRLDDDGAMYCRTDTHWSGRACELVARRLAKELADRPWMRDVPRSAFTARPGVVSMEGDLVRGVVGAGKPAAESLPLRFIERAGDAGPAQIDPDPASPVVLLADSHGLIFHAGDDMLARGAGLADQLAMELGFAVDLVAVRGSGATPARVALFRRSQANPDYLKGKRIVIWCLTAREFTEANSWMEVPLSRPAGK